MSTAPGWPGVQAPVRVPAAFCSRMVSVSNGTRRANSSGSPPAAGRQMTRNCMAPVLRLRLEAGFGPALEHRDPVGGPGAVAGHGAAAELLQDVAGVRLHVVVGPKVERPRHRLA